MEKTTDLEKLRQGEGFTWGELIKIHSIGEYNIVEYYEWERDGIRVLTGKPTQEKGYSCYVDGHSIGQGTDSLDSAIVICIAYKHDGYNSQAVTFFMKMIGAWNSGK